MPSVSEAAGKGQFQADGLCVYFGEESPKCVLKDVSLSAAPGQITGVVGESGSGKTTAVLTAIGLPPTGSLVKSGQSLLDGRRVLGSDRPTLRKLWASDISYVSQDATSALNPALRVGTQLIEVLTRSVGLSRSEASARAVQLLKSVHLPGPDEALARYPHQFSGGQLQRVAIAIAIACDPSLLILDEPTTGLDVTTQTDVVHMLRSLIKQRGMAAIYISHDLALVGTVADTIVVMYAGEVLESGPVGDVVGAPRHPYTRALLDSVLSSTRRMRPRVLEGRVPAQVVANACPFAPRCEFAVSSCKAFHPDLELRSPPSHLVRCFRSAELGTLPPRSCLPPTEPEESADLRPILQVEGLICRYRSAPRHTRPAVANASLSVWPGKVAALVGESGSGKTTIGRVLAGVLPPLKGTLRWSGAEMAADVRRRSFEQRRNIQLVFQNPSSSLNPRHTVGTIIGRTVRLFRPELRDGRSRAVAVAQALIEVQLDPSIALRYPHQLSGGQKQRVAIARAFAARPKLVICDEIVSSQDVSVQAAILELVRSMGEKHGTALLFISHDLAVVRSIADVIYVMHEGEIVERGDRLQIFDRPQHPYTRQLLTAAASLESTLITANHDAPEHVAQ